MLTADIVIGVSFWQAAQRIIDRHFALNKALSQTINEPIIPYL